jgi:GMP synthase (glutamine-hydrolysing)
MPRILIFQASPVATQDRVAALGAKTNTQLFSDALTAGWAATSASASTPASTRDPLEFFTLNIADGEALPQGMSLQDFSGVVITGSPLNIYHAVPNVTRQIELAREIFDAGIPSFGSCWGLQLMTAALGGKVRLNPNGREFGIARNIILNETGRAHALYSGKSVAFDALCSHEDEIEVLPQCGVVLASNSVSRVQAAVMEDDAKSFWGVQYHPEFDFDVLAALMLSRPERYVENGFQRDVAGIETVAAEYRELAKTPARGDLIWRHGVTENCLDPKLQRVEFENWLRVKVAPYVDARDAG